MHNYYAYRQTTPTAPQPAWPTQHTHYELQYTPGQSEWSRKDVNYDFDNKALRYDIQHLSGPEIPFITLLNFSSYWLADALYMVTWATPLDNVPTCIQLNLGFGMMKPECVRARATPTAHARFDAARRLPAPVSNPTPRRAPPPQLVQHRL